MTPTDEPQSKAPTAEEPEGLTSTSPSQNKWIPTQQTFEKLLAAFDSDPGQAGEIYKSVRRKLLRYFERNGIVDTDRWADETLDRVMRHLDEGRPIVKLMAYIYTVASYVCMEARNEQKKMREVENGLPTTTPPPQGKDIESPRQLCLDKCLNELPVETRILILDYYSEERSTKIRLRRQMAKDLGIEMNALRIRAHRIRVSLETCVRECISQLA